MAAVPRRRAPGHLGHLETKQRKETNPITRDHTDRRTHVTTPTAEQKIQWIKLYNYKLVYKQTATSRTRFPWPPSPVVARPDFLAFSSISPVPLRDVR